LHEDISATIDCILILELAPARFNQASWALKVLLWLVWLFQRYSVWKFSSLSAPNAPFDLNQICCNSYKSLNMSLLSLFFLLLVSNYRGCVSAKFKPWSIHYWKDRTFFSTSHSKYLQNLWAVWCGMNFLKRAWEWWKLILNHH
jgi:hypothetical protein